MAKGQIKQKQATIDQKQFEVLCAIQCTREEICGVFDISKDTLLRWCKATYGTDFETVYEQKKQNGKASLRRTMFKQAEKNSAMAIWLSKQHLGMKEPEQEVKHSGEINNTFINAINEASKDIWKDEEKEE